MSRLLRVSARVRTNISYWAIALRQLPRELIQQHAFLVVVDDDRRLTLEDCSPKAEGHSRPDQLLDSKEHAAFLVNWHTEEPQRFQHAVFRDFCPENEEAPLLTGIEYEEHVLAAASSYHEEIVREHGDCESFSK